MDELVVQRHLGEGIDAVLVDLQPVGDAGLLSDMVGELISGNGDHGVKGRFSL